MSLKPFKIPGILFIAGGLLPLSLAPFSLWPLAIISLLPLCIYLQHQTAKHSIKHSIKHPIKQAIKNAAVFGFGMYLTGASWVYISMYEHGDVSMAFAIVGTLLFCLLMALLFALPFGLAAFLPQTPAAWVLGFPALWVLSEWFRSWIFTGFPWLYVGYSHTDTWLSGWAPLGGVFLLSYLTALNSATLAQLLQRRISVSVLVGSAVIAISFIGGYFFQTINWTQPVNTQLSVAMVQPNVDQKDKWAVVQRNRILRGLLSQTEPHWGTDIIIWPEGAIPALFTQAEEFLEDLDQRAKQHKTALITGIPTDNNAARHYYNSMLALGEGQGQYNKTRLVPFGEYVPFQSLIRGLNNFFDLPMSSFSLGAKYQTSIIAKQQPIATAICYEIAYPDLVAKNVRDTNLLLTVSNDAWFGDSIAPQQHMQMARMRAMENAKPLMRGTNNGITALVDQRGKIYQQLPQFDKGVLKGHITPRTGSTPFSVLSSWPTIGFSLLSLVILITLRLRKST
jgi:apolipoprotein N-acyltransferase